jgi:hypothetical protein
MRLYEISRRDFLKPDLRQKDKVNVKEYKVTDHGGDQYLIQICSKRNYYAKYNFSSNTAYTYTQGDEANMKLTVENKKHIDSLSYYDLLAHWRFAPVGDPWMQDETGQYWGERMAELRAADNDMHVRTSKALG